MNAILFVLAVVTYLCYVQGQTPCRSPSGAGGGCVAVTQCPALLTLVNKSSRTPAETMLLRQAHCGYQGTLPMVCCAAENPPPPVDNACFTPDAKLGRCVGAASCAHIANMLSQKPIPKDIKTYVQNSRCMGPETYSVCCGPPPGPAPVPNGQCVNTAAPPDPRTECCGHDGGSGNRIFGGNATKVDQYPWLALIEYTSKNKIQLLCGAALISGKYVLTAGHCVAGTVLNYGTPTNVRLGEYDINNSGPDCVTTEGNGEDCSAELVVVPIEKITVHPEYNPKVTASRHDIALIRLTEVVPYTDFIRPICLPTTDITISPPPSLYLYAAGWGATSDFTSSSNVKLHVELPYRSLQVCQPKYNSQRLRTQLWNGQLCAGGEIGKDTCKGDSGGPLMYENQNKIYEIIGIVSFGPTPCGMENVPGVYTKVYEYNLWIRSNIKP